jgi:hypothetical protein
MNVLAVAGAWLAFVGGLFAGGEIADAGALAVAAIAGAALVVVGSAAASRCRLLPQRTNTDRMRLVGLSLFFGAVLGSINLAANWLIARGHPAIHALLAERMRTLAPMNGLVASPLVEEVAVRLFLMSVVVWLVFRLTKRTTLAFAIGLAASALVFALLHLGRPFPGDPALADYYRSTLVLKYTAAGLPLGWVFWRWGLPYSILCHVAANAAHLVLQARVF